MPVPLAIHGGIPVRGTLLPYSRQSIDDADVRAVTEVLKSDWLTTGPKVNDFERAFAIFTGAQEAVAVSNGTAALHAAMHALDIAEGDDVIVPTMTFAATANAVVFRGGTPVFVDVDPETLLADPAKIKAAVTRKTKAVAVVDYAGQPCDYDAVRAVTGLPVVADACHALGGSYGKKNVGTLGDLNTFSFHAVKPLATGEGGMITTNDADCAARMRRFRNHGITGDHRERQEKGSWFYEMQELGYNYRLTDIQCALGISQLAKVAARTARRQEIAKKYDTAFAKMDTLAPLTTRPDVSHAYHLYVIRLNPDTVKVARDEIFHALRAENIGVNVHYIPVHLHPFYRKQFGTKAGDCPVAEKAYEEILSLPLFASMTDADAENVIEAVRKVCAFYRK
ncbi:MAG: UDP-4-amino-4,6-dideoxy-N-acetyl-beta-L-altrosamine transaminase [Candidatus Peribacteraceae bacterium]|nr:UDP-4-amino-4,6-dideoxy-N-acetyl-beta-L-altrosamine transaminase [Candidatus Peribacteraceae bacterium]MDD5074794.1 UDP-4-amino-4,6-dideoxy-N-acetyl-beta-L-altrosamine transaminase [Candidatus Peribacteraceae bacterium]